VWLSWGTNEKEEAQEVKEKEEREWVCEEEDCEWECVGFGGQWWATRQAPAQTHQPGYHTDEV